MASFTEENVRRLIRGDVAYILNPVADRLNPSTLKPNQHVFLVEPWGSIDDSLFVQIESTYKESTKTYIMYTVLAKSNENKVTIIPLEDRYETFTGPFDDGYYDPYTIYPAVSVTDQDWKTAERMTNGLYDPMISINQTTPGQIYLFRYKDGSDIFFRIAKVISITPKGAIVIFLKWKDREQDEWTNQSDVYVEYFIGMFGDAYPPESEQTRTAREKAEAEKLRLEANAAAKKRQEEEREAALAALAKRQAEAAAVRAAAKMRQYEEREAAVAALAKKQAEEAEALEKKRAAAAAAEAKAVANAKAKAEANDKAIAEAKVTEQVAIQNALNTLYTVPYLDLEEGGEYYVQTTQNSSAFMKIKVSAMMDGYVICTPLSRGSILKKEGEWTNIEKQKEKATNLDRITLDDTTIFYRKKGIFSSIWPFSGGHLASRRSRNRNRNRINLNTTRKHRTTRKH